MFNLCCIGLNHKTAPLEIREKFAIPDEKFLDLINELKDNGKISGGVWLQTCNRSEFYFVSEEKVEKEILALIISKAGVEDFKEDVFYILRDLNVVEHLFYVSSSLDSMVVGEPQILGQVKEAYEYFLKKQSTNTLINELFQVSLKVGKKVRTETGIGEGAVSVPYVAVELAKKVFEDLNNLKILFIGAGEMAELSLTHLIENGAKEIFILNRTEEKAKEIAQRFGGKGYSLNLKNEILPQADLVISCTSSPEPLLKPGDLKEALKKRKYKPIVLIDMAVPGDIDKDVSSIEGCFLYNIDDLKFISEENKKEREKRIFEAEKIISEEVIKFKNRWEVIEISPFIQEIREHIWGLKKDEMEKFFNKNLNLNEEQKKEIEIFTDGLLQKILHPFFDQVKKMKPKKSAQNLIKKFFGLGKL